MAAEAAAESGTAAGEDLSSLLRGVYDRAVEALERTPELLPILKQAGVVDAGGAGFLLLLAAFLEEVSGTEVAVPDSIFSAAVAPEGLPEREDSLADLRYEVMFFLEAPEGAIEEFTHEWAGLGDSIVVVGGEGTYNCHIHTDEVGPAIEVGIKAGRPYRIQITDLLDQAAAEAFHGAQEFEPLPEFAEAPVAVIPVVSGEGLVSMFRHLGAQRVVTGGQTMNPSTQDLLTAVDAVPAQSVVLLPNNKNIIPVAQQVGGLTTKDVLVVPCASLPQGLAAMVAYFPGNSDGAALAAAMESAAGEVATGELTRATRDAETPVGEVRRGAWLGLADGEICIARDDEESALIGLLAHLVDGTSELATLITGIDAGAEVTSAAVDWLAAHRPHVEAEVVDGGQPLYPYLISVE